MNTGNENEHESQSETEAEIEKDDDGGSCGSAKLSRLSSGDVASCVSHASVCASCCLWPIQQAGCYCNRSSQHGPRGDSCAVVVVVVLVLVLVLVLVVVVGWLHDGSGLLTAVKPRLPPNFLENSTAGDDSFLYLTEFQKPLHYRHICVEVSCH